jgi:hypothetical protein
MRNEVPSKRAVGPKASEPLAKVVWCAVGKLARSVDYRREKQGIPGRLKFLGSLVRARLQRQSDRRVRVIPAQEQVRVIGVGDVVDLSENDLSPSEAVIDRVVRQFPG